MIMHKSCIGEENVETSSVGDDEEAPIQKDKFTMLYEDGMKKIYR